MTVAKIFLLIPAIFISFVSESIASPLKTNFAKSQVSAVFRQMNVPVDARFMKFDAVIDFSPAKPEMARANVTIDISSFDLGDPDYNREVLKKEWFDSVSFPKASFVASKIKAYSSGKLDVQGKLTIKGKVLDLNFPLSVKKESGFYIFEGSIPIKRLYFGIGEGEWKDTSIVADEVIIKFKIYAE